MTILRQLVRIVRPTSPLERYYGELLRQMPGGTGLPSAREAHRDLKESHALRAGYYYR